MDFNATNRSPRVCEHWAGRAVRPPNDRRPGPLYGGRMENHRTATRTRATTDAVLPLPADVRSRAVKLLVVGGLSDVEVYRRLHVSAFGVSAENFTQFADRVRAKRGLGGVKAEDRRADALARFVVKLIGMARPRWRGEGAELTARFLRQIEVTRIGDTPATLLSAAGLTRAVAKLPVEIANAATALAPCGRRRPTWLWAALDLGRYGVPLRSYIRHYWRVRADDPELPGFDDLAALVGQFLSVENGAEFCGRVVAAARGLAGVAEARQ